MKKRGFTLAEILVTIGVIGIVAAVSMPLVSKFKPDDNKIKFLQTYDSIVEATVALANNRVLYPTIWGQNIYDKAPFGNTVQPKDVGLKLGAYSGTPKFCRLLAYSFGVDATTTCQKTYVDYNDKFASNFTPDFTTQNGVDFMILTKGPTIAGNTLFYRSDIYIDINGSEEGKNCSYSANCKIPDRFKLAVASDGEVAALDPMARKYLQTRSNWKYREGMEGSKWKNFVDESKYIEQIEVMDDEKPPVVKYEEPKKEEEKTEVKLPAGQRIAQPQPKAKDLRKTATPGIYCENHNPSRPPGDYSMQRHYYWHKELGAWVEYIGKYYTDSTMTDTGIYDQPDAGDIGNYFNVPW